MEGGSEFVVVFTKEYKLEGKEEGEFQVVARVSDDIRAAIKLNRDKIFIGFNSHHVTDRFYVKSCSKCHKFGHYHKDCQESASCGFCTSEEHETKDCEAHTHKDQTKYKCTNCEASGKESNGHSSFWKKCPM